MCLISVAACAGSHTVQRQLAWKKVLIRRNFAEFIKQTAKRLKGVQDMPSKDFLAEEHELLQFCMKLGSEPGWHFVDGAGVHVAQSAKAFRTLEPRFSQKEYPLRTTFSKEPRRVAIARRACGFWRAVESTCHSAPPCVAAGDLLHRAQGNK